MNVKQKRKLIGVVTLVSLLSIAIGLVLYALKQNINLFYTPSQLISLTNPAQIVRVGGYVQKHSVHYSNNGQQVDFIIMDTEHSVAVHYSGVLPSLFREGQGVVVTGKLVNANNFAASEVLAKHDEKYVPKYMMKDSKIMQQT